MEEPSQKENAEIDWEILNPSFLKQWQYIPSSEGYAKRKEWGHCRIVVWFTIPCSHSGMVTRVLEIIDRAAAAFSIEPRYPFFDKRLVEFCLSLPANQKLYRGWTRIIMRRAMANILPEIIQWRVDKIDFYPSFRQGLLDYGRESLQEIIGNESKIIENYINKTVSEGEIAKFLMPGEN